MEKRTVLTRSDIRICIQFQFYDGMNPCCAGVHREPGRIGKFNFEERFEFAMVKMTDTRGVAAYDYDGQADNEEKNADPTIRSEP